MARGFSFKEAAPSKPVTASTLNGLLMNPRHTRPLCFEVPNVTGPSVPNLCWMANLTFQACDYAKNALHTDIFKFIWQNVHQASKVYSQAQILQVAAS